MASVKDKVQFTKWHNKLATEIETVDSVAVGGADFWAWQRPSCNCLVVLFKSCEVGHVIYKTYVGPVVVYCYMVPPASNDYGDLINKMEINSDL